MPNSSIDIFNDQINNTLNIIHWENKICYFLKHLNIDLLKYEEHRLTSEFLDLINKYNVYPLTSKPRYDSHSTHSSSWVTVGILVRSCLGWWNSSGTVECAAVWEEKSFNFSSEFFAFNLCNSSNFDRVLLWFSTYPFDWGQYGIPSVCSIPLSHMNLVNNWDVKSGTLSDCIPIGSPCVQNIFSINCISLDAVVFLTTATSLRWNSSLSRLTGDYHFRYT